MKRLAPLGFLLLGGAAPAPPALDVNESGRVLATLDDWRAIIFVLVILLFLQLFERWWSGWQARIERRENAEIARSFATSASKVADALGTVHTEMQVLRALTSRVESDNARP